jgi:hypothetical protein
MANKKLHKAGQKLPDGAGKVKAGANQQPVSKKQTDHKGKSLRVNHNRSR